MHANWQIRLNVHDHSRMPHAKFARDPLENVAAHEEQTETETDSASRIRLRNLSR